MSANAITFCVKNFSRYTRLDQAYPFTTITMLMKLLIQSTTGLVCRTIPRYRNATLYPQSVMLKIHHQSGHYQKSAPIRVSFCILNHHSWYLCMMICCAD